MRQILAKKYFGPYINIIYYLCNLFTRHKDILHGLRHQPIMAIVINRSLAKVIVISRSWLYRDQQIMAKVIAVVFVLMNSKSIRQIMTLIVYIIVCTSQTLTFSRQFHNLYFRNFRCSKCATWRIWTKPIMDVA